MKKFSFKGKPNPDCDCGGRAVKHGLLKNHNNTVQRYRCLVCNTRFLSKGDYSINIEPSPIVKHPGYANTSCVMLVKDKSMVFIDQEDERLAALQLFGEFAWLNFPLLRNENTAIL